MNARVPFERHPFLLVSFAGSFDLSVSLTAKMSYSIIFLTLNHVSRFITRTESDCDSEQIKNNSMKMQKRM